jgi:hypothetical protein
MTTFQVERSPLGSRPDDDVGEVEPDVGEGGQELRVEARRALVPFPPLATRAQLVDAVLGQGRDQPGQVARVLGDRVALPELADLVVQLRGDRAPHLLDDVVVLVVAHQADWPPSTTIVWPVT